MVFVCGGANKVTPKFIAKIVWAVASSVIYHVAIAPLMALGLVAVPINILAKKPPQSGSLRFLWLWYNDQDGYVGDTFWQKFNWGAIRNPVSNFRFLGLFKPKEVTKEVIDNHTVYTSRWMTQWIWDHPEKRKFTQFGARLNKPWSGRGTNFSWRPYSSY
jgi:hypothetical protein